MARALVNQKDTLNIHFLRYPITALSARKKYLAKVLYLTSPNWVVDEGGVIRGGATCIVRHYLELYDALQYHSGNNTFLQLAGVVCCFNLGS